MSVSAPRPLIPPETVSSAAPLALLLVSVVPLGFTVSGVVAMVIGDQTSIPARVEEVDPHWEPPSESGAP